MTNPDKLKPRRNFLQVGISTVLLFMLAISSWLSYWVLARETTKMEMQLPGLRDAARELYVTDESAITIVNKHPQWSGETIWDINLPHDRTFKLCIATAKIQRRSPLPDPVEQINLPSGRHQIEFTNFKQDDDSSELGVWVDGEQRIKINQPKSWHGRAGSSGASKFSRNETVATDSDVRLFEQVFMVDVGDGTSKTPNIPSAGVAIWLTSTPVDR